MNPAIEKFIRDQLAPADANVGRHVCVIEDAALPPTALAYRQENPTAFCSDCTDTKDDPDLNERTHAILQACDGLELFAAEISHQFVSQRPAVHSEQFNCDVIEVVNVYGQVMVTFYTRKETV